MSKSLNLTITLLKRSGQEAKMFIAITVLISGLIFNFLNLMEFEKLTPGNLEERIMIISPLAVVLIVAFSVLYAANNYLIKVKAKEIGIEALSGISTFSLGFLLTVQTSILNGLGYLFGMILGIIISPIFNFLAMKEWIFQINMQSVMYMLMFFLLQTFTLGLINQGFGYRNEIIELLGISKKNQFISERYKKKLGLKHWIPVLATLSMVGLLFIPKETIEKLSEVSIFLFLIPILGAEYLFKSSFPLFLDKLKEKHYLSHKYYLIIISNIKTSIKKNEIVFESLLGIGAILPALMIIRPSGSIPQFFIFLSFILAILFITFLMIFKGMSSSLDEIQSLKQLRVLGYSKDEITKILRLKINIFYGILITIPLFITTVQMVFLVKNSDFSLGYGIIYVGVYILVYFLAVSITYIYSIREINKNLYMD